MSAQVFQQGVDAYHAGDHYEAHEHWEILWQDEQNDDRRGFLQALIQMTSAVHKARNDVGPRGCLRLLAGAEQRLSPLDDVFLGIDLATLRSGMARLSTEVQRLLEVGDGCKIAAGFVPTLNQVAALPLWTLLEAPQTVAPEARQGWFDGGLAAYQRGEHFEAHEFWEELWRDEPAGPDRQFLQGLIQVAAAMHKMVLQKKPDPASRLLGRAILKLESEGAHDHGLQLKRLLGECRSARRALIELAKAGDEAEAFDLALIPTVARKPRAL